MVADEDEDHWRIAGTVPRYIERFASVLTEAGIPRMPARVSSAVPGVTTTWCTTTCGRKQ